MKIIMISVVIRICDMAMTMTLVKVIMIYNNIRNNYTAVVKRRAASKYQ